MWPLALAGLLAGGASAYGQHRANVQSRQLTREGMAFEAEQVQKQMQFQERMSGSAYQRATEDMRLAGINPMLAYAQGGASTPGGGAASGAAATMQDVAGPAVASAQHARQLHADLKRQQEETKLATERQWTEVQSRRESRSREDMNYTLERESSARAQNLGVQTQLGRLQVPQAERAADLYRGRAGGLLGVTDRLFGRGILNPFTVR